MPCVIAAAAEAPAPLMIVARPHRQVGAWERTYIRHAVRLRPALPVPSLVPARRRASAHISLGQLLATPRPHPAKTAPALHWRSIFVARCVLRCALRAEYM